MSETLASAGWALPRTELLRAMARGPVAEGFSRDEWAYLMAAIRDLPDPPVDRTARSPVAIWLPSNVSLLGAHAITLVAWTGAEVHAKVGTRGRDLTETWVEWARRHSTMLSRVQLRHFDREDQRSAAEMSCGAQGRIAFGSDEAVSAVQDLPHDPHAPFYGFGDRRSEAWLDVASASEKDLRALVRAFAIFGRAGCTSPSRAVLIGGTSADADRLRDLLAALWPKVIREPVEMHMASQNAMATQVVAACGWRPVRTAGSAAVVASGPLDAGPAVGTATLPVVAASLEEAVATVPANLQTIGYATATPDAWKDAVAATPACRFVQLTDMHTFSPVWDGLPWWEGLWR
jgi:hypothetical protein